MSDNDYLWDGLGAPDPELARLEAALSAFAYRGEPPRPEAVRSAPRPARIPQRPRPRSRSGLRRPHVLGMLAASLLIGLGLGAVVFEGAPRRPAAFFTVEATQGTPRYASRPLNGRFGLLANAWLQTDDAAEARINLADYGALYVSSNSRIRVKRLDIHNPIVEVRYGRIQGLTLKALERDATLISLETPSIHADDQGGVYELTVDGSGWTRLRVDRGQVALKDQTTNRIAFVPAGALCETLPGQGLGVPTFTTASIGLRQAVRAMDLRDLDADRQELNFTVMLVESEVPDTLSLFHMVERVDPRRRLLIVDRICTLVPLPADIERRRLLQAEPRALGRWREHLMPVWRARPQPRDGALAPEPDGGRY